MERQPGAYVLIDGELQPDLNDEAMAARQPKEEKPRKTKTVPDPTPAEVANVKE